MTGLNPGTPLRRRYPAVLAALGLALTRLPAQPLAPLPTNDVAAHAYTLTNQVAPELVTTSTETSFSTPTKLERYDFVLATARFQANTHAYPDAEKNFVKLLAEDVPEAMRQTALFELAQVVRSENDLPRAQAVFTQYLQRWPGDSRTPEIYLRQGQVFREMGLPNMALAKFYGVMTTALSLKNNQLPYFKGLVLQAQMEIAETHYLEGNFKDAVDYYSRLLTQNDPALDRAQIQFRLIRSLEAVKNHTEAASQARDFLAHFPAAREAPEVRYHLAQAYKGQNRNTEALQEVRTFLQEEHDQATNNPSIWAYWQERVGNEIGNQLYQEGDYVKALQVYLALCQLDSTPAWQLPVRYQVGITYEKLLQPRLAMEAYRNLLTNAVPGLGANAAPNLKAVTEMAAWRLHFLEWNERADAFNHPADLTTSTNLSFYQP